MPCDVTTAALPRAHTFPLCIDSAAVASTEIRSVPLSVRLCAHFCAGIYIYVRFSI
jgi:hypothetical protein